MSQIFVSYASENRTRVAKLVAALEEKGWTVFWDRRIPAGESYESYIGREISEASCLVAVWSRASVDPNNEWVREEALEGKTRKILVPVLIEDVSPPYGFKLINAADLVRWKGDGEAPEFHRLVADISRIAPPKQAGASIQVFARPGERVGTGVYEERDAKGNALPDGVRIGIKSENTPLPPTSKPDRWWVKL